MNIINPLGMLAVGVFIYNTTKSNVKTNEQTTKVVSKKVLHEELHLNKEKVKGLYDELSSLKRKNQHYDTLNASSRSFWTKKMASSAKEHAYNSIHGFFGINSKMKKIHNEIKSIKVRNEELKKQLFN